MILDDKEIQDVLIKCISQRKKLTPVLDKLGISWKELVSYTKDNDSFKAAWEEALEACAEGIFEDVIGNIASVTEYNAQSSKTKLDYAKYVLKILNPNKFIEKQELSIKHQQLTPTVHITLTHPKDATLLGKGAPEGFLQGNIPKDMGAIDITKPKLLEDK